MVYALSPRDLEDADGPRAPATYRYRVVSSRPEDDLSLSQTIDSSFRVLADLRSTGQICAIQKMEDISAYSLIRKFQQLQEERVHVYKIFQEGHKIYLSSAPNYNFIQFRALVQDVTQDFKRISEEIIKIECQLRVIQPDLSLCVADVQDCEKQHLELIAHIQLAKQELQDCGFNGTKSDNIQEELNKLKKQLAAVHEKISESMENIRYQLADLE